MSRPTEPSPGVLALDGKVRDMTAALELAGERLGETVAEVDRLERAGAITGGAASVLRGQLGKTVAGLEVAARDASVFFDAARAELARLRDVARQVMEHPDTRHLFDSRKAV